MADDKKYYYLKLKEDFFESDELLVLESMPEGIKYSNILLKLYLKSIKNEGKLMFKERIPYSPTILSTITRQSVGDVEKALRIFKELGLIEIMDNGAIYMLDIQNFIGKSSTEADRKRSYRLKIEAEKTGLNQICSDDQKSGQMSQLQNHDGQMSRQMSGQMSQSRQMSGQVSGQMSQSGQMSDKNPPELELELEKEPEPELKREKKGLGFFEKSEQETQSLTVGTFNNLSITKNELQTLYSLYSETVSDNFLNQLSIQVKYGKVKDIKSTFNLVKNWIEKSLENGNTRLPDGYGSPYSKQPMAAAPKYCCKCNAELDSSGKCPNCKIAIEYQKATNTWEWIELATDEDHSVINEWLNKRKGVI